MHPNAKTTNRRNQRPARQTERSPRPAQEDRKRTEKHAGTFKNTKRTTPFGKTQFSQPITARPNRAHPKRQTIFTSRPRFADP